MEKQQDTMLKNNSNDYFDKQGVTNKLSFKKTSESGTLDSTEFDKASLMLHNIKYVSHNLLKKTDYTTGDSL